MQFKLYPVYFALTLLLFIIEVLIGAYLHDAVVRPFVGDFLVVILVYCFVKSFFSIRVWPAAIGSLLFAYLVEFGQYLNILEWLGWERNKLARLLMGTFFTWTDMLMYTLGIALVIVVEYVAGNVKTD